MVDDNLLPAPAQPIEKKLENTTFINKVRRMKYCSDRCPAYDFCPSMPLAQNSKEDRKPCVLRTMPEKMKKRFERLFMQGQDGIVKELLSAVYTVGYKTDIEGDLSDHRAYVGILNTVTKTLYGNQPEPGNQQSTVTVNVISLEDSMGPKPENNLNVIDIEALPAVEKSDEEMLKEYESKWGSD